MFVLFWYRGRVPRITEARREARREQVLDAARACLQERGLEAVSMEMIIDRSGLSTGAVYGYFKGKDQIINAVVTEGTAAMARELAPVLTNPAPPPLPELVGQVLRTAVAFGRDGEDGIDRLLVSLHGWSHSQSDPELKAATRASYAGLRALFAGAVRRWQAAGTFDPAAHPDAVAELLTSVTLGFVAQRALAGSADVGRRDAPPRGPGLPAAAVRPAPPRRGDDRARPASHPCPARARPAARARPGTRRAPPGRAGSPRRPARAPRW
jgi:AcrR family transcriptional regulator